MKTFAECDRRWNNICIQFPCNCLPGQELPIIRCWRMYMEGDKYLQCPTCHSRLWKDLYSQNQTCFCPKCKTQIPKNEGIQTLEYLNAEFRRCERQLAKFDKLVGWPSPEEFARADELVLKREKIKKLIDDFKRFNIKEDEEADALLEDQMF